MKRTWNDSGAAREAFPRCERVAAGVTPRRFSSARTSSRALAKPLASHRPVSLQLAYCPAADTVSDAKDYSIFVVRRSGGGGGEVLRLGLQEFEDQADHALYRGGTGREEGPGDDGGLRAGGRGVRGAQRRAAVQVHQSDLVRDQLRHAGG